MDKNIGMILNDRYELTEVIGVGGMSVVYKAYDKLIDRIVAVKVLKDEFTADTKFRKRFTNESRVISMLSHINIVDVYDVNLEGDMQYIVMEYVNGITLKQYMEKQGVLSWSEALFFVEQILNGLAHAHERGIIHRDIKPHNIMLLPDGTIKVADFGIARISKFDTVTIMDKAIGSVHYISPEQASKNKIDEKSDIYSVGVILYEMVTGTLPFEGDTPVTVALMQVQDTPKKPSEINPEIPAGLEQIILKAMSKNPDNRYQSARQMIEDIEKFRKNPSIVYGYSSSDFTDSDFSKTIELTQEELLLKNKKPQKEKHKGRGVLAPVITGILLAILLSTGLLIALSLYSSKNPIETVIVPNLVGLSFEEVQNDAELKRNFTVVEDGREFSDKYDAGLIIKQVPDKDLKVMPGREIRVIISKGKRTETVPDVVNLDQSAAAVMLEAKGFIVERKYESNAVIREDAVIRTDPAANTDVSYGSVVTIYISTGDEVKMTIVPNVIEKFKDDAINLLREAKLNYTVIDIYSDTVSKNRVISQSIDSNVEVEQFTNVIIYVSKGPSPTSSETTSSETTSSETTSSESTSSETTSSETASSSASSDTSSASE